MVEVLTQDWVGENVSRTHPWMSWWVWFKYSPVDESVRMVGVLTQE